MESNHKTNPNIRNKIEYQKISEYILKNLFTTKL